MTREDNPEYYAHVCDVISAIFKAEHKCIERDDILNKLKANAITPQEYIESIADELISTKEPEEIE